MSGKRAAAQISYLGWSGFHVRWEGGAEVLVDPPPGPSAELGRDAHVLVTHGHPDHVAGAARILSDGHRAAAVTVVASPAVGRFLQRRRAHARDRVLLATPPGRVELPGLAVDVFTWSHMSLVPPGLGPSLGFVWRLVRRPRVPFAILRDAVVGPRRGPPLGFRLTPSAGAERVLVYAEGLHRRTDRAAAARTGDRLRAEVLLFAVEPEDVDVLPELVADVGCPRAFPYEAHRPWREALGLPVADLDALAAGLEERRVDVMSA